MGVEVNSNQIKVVAEVSGCHRNSGLCFPFRQLILTTTFDKSSSTTRFKESSESKFVE